MVQCGKIRIAVSTYCWYVRIIHAGTYAEPLYRTKTKKKHFFPDFCLSELFILKLVYRTANSPSFRAFSILTEVLEILFFHFFLLFEKYISILEWK